ncbi:MAG: hypothetical protein Q612_NSC00147G0003 [Negativicoccus succinicivorans DORA_17_25]|uniref:Uncharacterized protein n=1 Tax=Negativicoccus succinicivorans DORA_17_25 TaxID=1403945 RepID=W1U729_9FIRM|nr:MAG: hypothetical protein Q612_NSC00147G0003 [Negativicoccus succinicivorans DORA_17_25]
MTQKSLRENLLRERSLVVLFWNQTSALLELVYIVYLNYQSNIIKYC